MTHTIPDVFVFDFYLLLIYDTQRGWPT